ncbi:MAG: alpha/beta hydrolase [Pseudomonadota bacterium]
MTNAQAAQNPSASAQHVLSDGRTLTYRVYGSAIAEARRVAIALHGTPGSCLKYAPASEAAAARGISLVAVDRWGYAGTAAPSADMQTLARFGQDIGELADALSLQSLDVVGISGGGPFAVAVAEALPERVRKLALVAPVGLLRTDDGARTEGLSLFHQFCFFRLPRRAWAVRAVFSSFDRILAARPASGISIAMARSGPADRKLLQNDEIVVGLARMMRHGMAPGPAGPAIDLKLFGELEVARVRLVRSDARVWFGDQDGSVPEAAVVCLARHMPRAALVRLEGQGHFWIATGFPKVLDWLAK